MYFHGHPILQLMAVVAIKLANEDVSHTYGENLNLNLLLAEFENLI